MAPQHEPIDVASNPEAMRLRDTTRRELLPVEPTTGIPLPPRAQPGYYPGFNTLSQQQYWDEATRAVVLNRVQYTPPIRFFMDAEVPLMQAIIDRIMPQDDRDDGHKIPIVPFIDERLHEGRIDGYRYDHMPPDREAYQLGLQAIEAIAQHLSHTSFVNLGPRQQDDVLITIHDGEPPAAQDIWQRVSAKHFWSMLIQDVVSVYYAHPFAWDEIGFGGPAYPRGYMRQEHGEAEPWEVNEQRYAWAPPVSALSVGDTSGGWTPSHPGEDQPAGGQGGTH